MGTEILKSFGTLQSELEQARSSLKGVDESIKRLIGRDPSEILPRPGIKRGPPTEENRGRQRQIQNIRNRNHENDEPTTKRRNGSTSVFKRLSERPIQYEDEFLQQQPQKQLISKVIVTPREIPSRQEALAAQSVDEKSKARNRRMFGALLGTLQKFQQEETKLKQKEEKRAQLEKKIEEHEIKEKAEIKKERQELFFNRKKKQAEIKMIELKMTRMKEYSAWEEKQKPRMNFIQTKAKPHIYYLPRKLNDTNRELLQSCRQEVEKMLDNKRQEVFEELQHIEERMKKNFEPKRNKKDEQSKEEAENNAQEEKPVEMETEEAATEQAVQEQLAVETNAEEAKDNIEKEATVQDESEKAEETVADETFSTPTVQNTESIGESEMPLILSQTNDSVQQVSQIPSETEVNETKKVDMEEE